MQQKNVQIAQYDYNLLFKYKFPKFATRSNLDLVAYL